MDQLEADHELLDRLKQDVITTMTHLQARLKAQLGDLGTHENKSGPVAVISDVVDNAAETICETLDAIRGDLPTAQEWRCIEEKAERDRLAKG